MKKIIHTLSILALSLNLLSNAHADTATQNMTANAQLQKSCRIVTNNLDLGTMIPNNTTVSATNGGISVQCTKNTTYVITLSTGNGTYAQRFMRQEAGTDQLNYQLYDVINRVVGDGTPGTVTFSGIAQGALVSHNMQAKLSYAQYVTPGKYSDTLTATITY